MFKPEGFTITADRWEQLYDAMERGYAVEGLITRVTWVDERPVWELDLGSGIRGLVPSSETGLQDSKLMVRFIGQKVLVKINGLDKNAENNTKMAACSRKDAIADATERFFQTVKMGMEIPVVVKAILPRNDAKPERLQVDVGGGILVEVERKRATRSLIHRLIEIYQPGATVKAWVTQADPQTGAIRVSLIDKADPWESFDVRRGDFLAGHVVGFRGDVILLEIKPGITGIANPPLRGRLRKGDVVPVAVSSFDRDQKKLRLRIKGGKLA